MSHYSALWLFSGGPSPQTPEEMCFRFNVFKDDPGYIGVLQPIKQH